LFLARLTNRCTLRALGLMKWVSLPC
jgi:hypothetical protein